MPQALQAIPDTASKPLATCRGTFPTQEPTVLFLATSRESPKRKWFPKLANIISKTKPAQYIAHLTREKERTAYDWCAGAVDPPSRVLIKLLDSPVGGIVIEEIMRGSTQKWWADLQQAKADALTFQGIKRQLEIPIK